MLFAIPSLHFKLDLVKDLVYIVDSLGCFKMTVQVNIYEAKSKLSKLINKVIAGEEVIVAKSGKPVARIIPFEKPTENRKPGSAKGKLIISDDFDAPLPDDILQGFYK